MNKYEAAYNKAAAQWSGQSWCGSAIAPLAVDLEERLGEPAVIAGPYGLRCEVHITVGHKHITITPGFEGEKNELRLYYDTGEVEPRHPALSVAWANGYNNVTARLPDTLDGIIAVMD